MKHRSVFQDSCGISLMYDALLFIVMVSIAGLILLPVSRTNIALDSLVDKHREDVVDNALHTFLVSRADFFQYRFCGTLIDDVAESIGINTSLDGLYASVTQWLLAHEQCHKTYENLLAENLGCQFQLPFSFFGMNHLNMFTDEYKSQLKNDTTRFFSSLFGEKYHYNLTAWWHPIKGIPFGGEFSVGERPPTKDCFVAHRFFLMPYTPLISFENQTILFTKHWVSNHLFSKNGMFSRSSIPAIANMTIIFENYTKKTAPYDTKENASRSIRENLSTLVYGFLIDGITNETNESMFPGVVHLTVMYGFEKIKNITTRLFDSTLDEIFGGAIRTIDRLFGNLNTSVASPLSQAILAQLNATLHTLLNESFFSLNEALDGCESLLKEQIIVLVSGYLNAILEPFVSILLDVTDTIMDFSERLVDWLFDQISLNKAEVMLTIWVVRE